MRIAPGGVVAAGVPGAVAVIAGLLTLWPVAAIGGLLALFVLVFYRDPAREPAGKGILAPADGRVKELAIEDGHLHVAIFLNIHNVHVVRALASGEVLSVERVDGHRHPSFLGRAANNAGIAVETDEWTTTLRAGLIARRVTSYVDRGDRLNRGDRLGHIAFGSRVDIRIPGRFDTSDLAVEVGDRVRAGETVLIAR